MMVCRFLNALAFVGLVLLVPTSLYALAPVENASSQTQGVQSDQSLGAATAADGSTQEATPMIDESASSPPSTANTDNTPLIGSSTAPSATQSPAISNSGGSDPTLLSMPLSERVARLEQQMQNMVHANLADQINNLQQQIQQLSGELQVQQHDITLLNQQLRNFYQDLSAQIKQMKNLSSNGDDTSNGTSTSDASGMGSIPPAAKKVKSAANPSMTEFTAQASDKYKVALSLLTKKKYDLAAKSFNEYINNYPNGHFVVNAHYWLGEIGVMQHNLPAAIEQFNIVITQFPHAAEVADAKVKLAIIHVSQGKTAQARSEFMKVKQAYPGTTAAQLAEIQLQQLGDE